MTKHYTVDQIIANSGSIYQTNLDWLADTDRCGYKFQFIVE